MEPAIFPSESKSGVALAQIYEPCGPKVGIKISVNRGAASFLQRGVLFDIFWLLSTRSARIGLLMP